MIIKYVIIILIRWVIKLTNSNRQGTTKSLGNKEINDKFYTKSSIAKSCINLIDLSKYDLIIEPSAGNGSFSNQIPNVKAFDLKPECDNIIQSDWFLLDKNQFKNFSNILVIGNPPFGNQGSLALKFIKESSFANTIAFILPKSFKKDSIKNRIPLNFWLEKEIDLPVNSFTLNGEDYSVNCVFQVWNKRDELRIKKKFKTTSKYFSFVDKAKADFRIQRVGGRAGEASKDLNRSTASNYFIKNKSDKTTDEFINIVNSIIFPTLNDTVGPRSLSKDELIREIEKRM